MSGIKNTAKRLTSGKFWKKEALRGIRGTWDPIGSAKNALNQAGDRIGEMMAPDNTALEQLAAAQAEANKAMPMPDDLELQRARRRAGATSRGGRASTIMSGGNNGQGLGG